MNVLVDNTVLANFVDIHFNGKSVIDLIRVTLEFNRMIVPESVKNEFANCPEDKITLSRERLLSNLESTGPNYYELCTSFDPVILGILSTEKNIHLGEAELIAQAIYRKISVVFTDDKACIKYIKNNYDHLRYYDSCVLIAMLDLYGGIKDTDYNYFIQLCLKKFNFDRLRLKEGYDRAYQIIGRPFDKQHVKKRLYLNTGKLLAPKKRKRRRR